MQASSMKQFMITRTGAIVVAVSILIAGAAGAIALTPGNELSGSQTVESARVMPQTFVGAAQGEGFVDATVNAIGNTQVVAHASVQQGEGLIDAGNRAISGRGIAPAVGTVQGEGFVDPTAALAAHSQLQAYVGSLQGEGHLDATIRGAATANPHAYSGPFQGEGLIGPGNTR